MMGGRNFNDCVKCMAASLRHHDVFSHVLYRVVMLIDTEEVLWIALVDDGAAHCLRWC